MKEKRSAGNLLVKEVLARRPELMEAYLGEITRRNFALEKENKELRAQAYEDGLTGLRNRRALKAEKEIVNARSERYGVPYGVLMVDADRFKQVNDTNGHDAGDRVLRKLAGVFRRYSRSEEPFYRVGGEEFLQIVYEADIDAVCRIAERLRTVVNREFIEDKDSPGQTISIGVASYPLHGMDLDIVIKAADSAVYKAKNGGRNRVCSPED